MSDNANISCLFTFFTLSPDIFRCDIREYSNILSQITLIGKDGAESAPPVNFSLELIYFSEKVIVPSLFNFLLSVLIT